MSNDDTGLGPFGRAARIYRAAGWPGALPAGRGPGQKSPPPGGYTGHGSPYPSDADIGTWEIGPEAGYNIGLRMPAGVIGLDIDAGYSKIEHGREVVKRGDETLAELEARLGPLPPTWVSSARPAPSGIRFFRVPTHLDGREINWPGEAGKFIEIIQPGHRYAVVWPSTNPDAGGAPYEWRAEGSWAESGPPGVVPRADALPALPEAWVRGLALPYEVAEKADLGLAGMSAWWAELRAGPLCPVIHSVCTKAVHELANAAGARHEVARDSLSAIVRAGGEGHRGAPEAVHTLGIAFEQAVGTERARGGEWDRLVSGAVKLAAKGNPKPRAMCEHDIPAATALAAPPGFTSPGAGSPISPPEIVAPGALTLPDTFWAARESLGRVRQAAHSRVRSADVVFAGLLCRLAAMVPHTLRADTGIGQAASLNLFAAVVGPSGGGKSSGLSVSRELVKAGRPLEEFPLGSGEGIAEAYMGEVEEPTGDMARDGSAKTKRVRKQVHHNALFHSDEGGGLNKLIERTGSTVGETLRTAWSGETLGQKNGRVETTRTVPARSYSAGLMIGYQPATVLPLLADVEAGTPQRFLYVWAVDPMIPPRSARVPWPGEITSPFPPEVPTTLPPPGAVFPAPPLPDLSPITFAEGILDELYDTEHAKATGSLPAGHWLLDEHGQLDPFKSQHTVLKVKVSALLALLESRRNVTADDWQLAQVVIDTSDRVRGYLQALARTAAGKARAAALAAEFEAETHRAHARDSVAAALGDTAARRIGVRVAEIVHEHGAMSRGHVRRRLAARDRELVDEGIEYAVAQGWVELAGDARIAPSGSRPVVTPAAGAVST